MLSDDRTVLNEADRQLCAELDASSKTPPAKKRRTTEATTLAVSEFPSASADPPLSPLSLFVADESETEMTRILTTESELSDIQTQDNPSQITPTAQQSDTQNTDIIAILNRLESLEKSGDERTRRLDKFEQDLFHQRRELREREARVSQCEQQLREKEERLARYELDQRMRDQRIRACEEQLRDRVVAARVSQRPRPDISDVTLHRLLLNRCAGDRIVIDFVFVK